MIVEQFLKDIQKLIARGTINPSAEISIEGEIELEDSVMDFSGNDLTVGVHESSYNELILFVSGE